MIASLNGNKVPIIVNAALLLPIIGVLVAMYSDVQQLKSDKLERGPVERIARLETQVQLGIDNRYRSVDAARDFALRDAEIARIKEDIKRLENHK